MCIWYWYRILKFTFSAAWFALSPLQSADCKKQRLMFSGDIEGYDLYAIFTLFVTPEGATSYPDRRSYEYDQITVSLCLMCLLLLVV